MVEVAVPGQRWEIEFFADDTIEIEIFISDGQIYDKNKIQNLLDDFKN